MANKLRFKIEILCMRICYFIHVKLVFNRVIRIWLIRDFSVSCLLQYHNFSNIQRLSYMIQKYLLPKNVVFNEVSMIQ